MKAVVRKQKQEAGRIGGLESGKIRAKETHGASHSASSRERMVRSGDLDQALEERKREAAFGAVWNRYPRKDGKQTARSEWLRLKPTDEQQRAIAADLD